MYLRRRILNFTMNTKLFYILLLMSLSIIGLAENPTENAAKRGSIKGHVIDALSNQPIEYATAALFSQPDNELIDGSITDVTGFFRIPKLEMGTYTLEVSFIGYRKTVMADLEINPANAALDLGNILLEMSAQGLSEVEIKGGTPAIEYQIDKKVIHVDKQLTAASGTAIDILESVPSVSVDIEGNVSLRGSSGFTVLIDGRPTILEPTDILNQIPASAIEDIEIITNPSAKYDPDGNAGIINIKMKKIRLEGFNGIFNANVGMYDRYGGDFLINYRMKKANVYLGADYNKRTRPGTSESERYTLSDDTLFYNNSIGSRDRQRLSWGVRSGVEFNFSKKDFASIGFRYGHRAMSGFSLLDYDEWMVPGGIHKLYESDEQWERGGDFYAINFDYTHKFAKKGQEIAFQVVYHNREMSESSTNMLRNPDGSIESGQMSTEDGPGSPLRIKIDYSMPLSEHSQLEAGYQSRFGTSGDDNKVYNYDTATNEYVFIPEYSHQTTYLRNIHSLYATYSGTYKKLGYKLGLRGEYTYRFMELVGESNDFTLNRFDYFPTIHLSYDLPLDNQIMASYGRRIDRPRGYYLEPFITVQDAYNVRQGNPELLPEYIDSYELGYQKRFGDNFVSLEAYYRVTHNKIERVKSVYQDNIMLNTLENVGTDYALGTELMLSLDIFKWWHADLMGNAFNYKVKGVLYEEPFERTSFNWGSRFNNTFLIGDHMRIQLNGNYVSQSVSAQGTRDGFWMANAAIKRDFLHKKITVVLQARDLFGTSKHESYSEGPDFYNYNLSRSKTPVVMLSVSFKLNNYRLKREKNGNGGGDEFGEDEF